MTRRGGIHRREFLAGAFGAAISLAGTRARADVRLPPSRAITRGPKHHWFGYYDKHQFDPTNRLVLGMEVDFEHRTPRADDTVRIGMVDLAADDRWIDLGKSTAWGWQQGCMLQWIPGSQSRVLWNDREKDRFVCRVLDVKTRDRRTIDSAIYTLSSDGRTAVTADFRRIQDVRPGYGYVGLPDPHAGDLAPKDSGVFRVDLDTGRRELIVSLADIAARGKLPRPASDAKHYFNHLLFNPDGTRFIFLHRWRYPKRGWLTRMLTAAPDGSDVRVIDDNGMTSHFIWRDPHHILAYSNQKPHGRAFYVFEDRDGGKVEPVGTEVMKRDGHCSYLPGGEWILNDTYPDKNRNQMPFLYHRRTGKVVPLGYFHLPKEYAGEWRCDTHPRASRDGRLVVIDAPVKGQGRQLHLIDIGKLIG